VVGVIYKKIGFFHRPNFKKVKMALEGGSVNRYFQVGKVSRKARCGKIGRRRRPISTARGNM
jgi:hypothetical protein